MSLSDRLETPAAPDVPYRPSVEFDNRGAVVETGHVAAEPGQPIEYAEILRSVGKDPERWRIVEVLRESHWQTYDERWLAAYRLRCEPIDDVAALSGLESLIAEARKVPTVDGPAEGPYWYVWQAGDLQLGKRSRDGSTEEIVERFVGSLAAARRQFNSLAGLGIAGVQISMPGDCIEGVVSQGGKNSWLTQETVTEQFRLLRRLMLEAVDTFRSAPEVKLDVVGGNHDDANRAWNTKPGDNWATEAACAVRDALALNAAAYGHVEVRVPEPWSGSMTVPVGDSVVTVVHGHQWRKGAALNWLAQQAVHMQPAGAAHVLQHGHWHTWALEGHKARTIVCSPTFDCGSDWYRERQGGESVRGAVTYLLRGGEVSNMSVL
ncbi:hypothetical protein FGG44_gp36 [Mycobacterium phage MacnCheese]|uniref:Exonuclease n=1 Tax=Mycobacterium phage MacnCheese TaxID=2927982 RepID=I6W7V0_9CAUD|nr:hypothetical protein FGG44_gp36 [Mycobacterium phage MacnCheese]AFN37730.1 hypothetical protein MACNCHEESE_36 [Mycobacterium phage MacnCheese]